MARLVAELVDSVSARILAYTERGDPAPVLSGAALEEGAELAAVALQPGGAALSVVYTLASFHWCRYLALPAGQNQGDAALARELFAEIAPVRTDLIPDEAALQLAEARHPAIDAAAWSRRAADAYHQFDRTDGGDAAAIDAAVTRWRVAVAAAPADDLRRAAYLNYLMSAYRTRFAYAGSGLDLDAAIAYGEEAVASASGSDPSRAMYLSNLGSVYRLRSGTNAAVADLDAAIAYGTQSVEAAPPGHPSRPLCLSDLGVAHRVRFEWAGAGADVDIAIGYGAEAVEAIAGGHPDRAYSLSSLGLAYLARFGWARATADLDAAIAYGEEAVEDLANGPRARAIYQSNLGLAHRMRFEQTGAETDLNAAIICATAAVEATSADDPDRAAMLSNLGLCYQARFDRSGAITDVSAAIMYGTAAAEAAPAGHPSRPKWLTNLGLAYQARARLTWAQAELNVAITNWAASAEATSADHRSRGKELPGLGAVYRAGSGRSGADADLDAAIAYGAEAVATTPADDHARASYLLNLGLAHKARFERDDAQQDLDAAIQQWSTAAASPAASPGLRMAAAREWGAAAATAGDAAAAADGLSAAVRLLPVLAWHGFDRELREEHLEDVAGLASDAAALAIDVGQPEQAVELLEKAGRSVLWSQLLQTRTTLTLLREQHPQLASRLDELHAALDHREPGSLPFEPVTGTAGLTSRENRETAAVARRRLAEEWDQLVNQVRALDGFTSFLAPIPFRELCRAGADGPAVLINVSGYRCDALVVTGHGVEVCPLQDLSKEECVRRANALLRVLDITPGRPEELLTAQVDRVQVLHALLRWLWDTISRPVLSHLGYLDTRQVRAAEILPRVWWCPTGPLTVLPLHAAGHHSEPDGENLANMVVSSYTPTLTALLRARERSPAEGEPRMLAIGMPTTPGAGDLRFADLDAVPDELERVTAHVPAHIVLSTPTRQELKASATIPDNRTEPTVERVLTAMDNHAWVHLACHSEQDLTDPAHGAVYLSDGPLTVLRIAAEDLPGADLAYLSACQTAIGGTRLLDESIHLAAAIQLAGYRHVIATQWSISDTHAPDVADIVYAELTTTGRPDPTRAAVAVHRAVAALRTREPYRPDLWAAYLHVGP